MGRQLTPMQLALANMKAREREAAEAAQTSAHKPTQARKPREASIASLDREIAQIIADRDFGGWTEESLDNLIRATVEWQQDAARRERIMSEARTKRRRKR